MTLRPTAVTPAAMKNLRPRKGGQEPIKCMVIDCKNDSQWRAIHEQTINGVVLRRRPIRAIESYFNNAADSVYEPLTFKCAQSRLRSELEKHLTLQSDEDELRRKFLINDITNWTRVLIRQTRSRDFLFKINQPLPTEYQSGPEALKMILTYRGVDIDFRQPKDKDERAFQPLGCALFKGQGYNNTPVEWKARQISDHAFSMTIEPFQRGMKV